jgi:transposase
VCKPFAPACWLVRTERWPEGSRIRTERWPKHVLVCKPELYCSQAATVTECSEESLPYIFRRLLLGGLYADETILWRFALPRAGWWRKAQRSRLPTRPLSQSQIKGEESRKRQAWVRYRSWSRVTSGVLLSVMGAVPYGTSKVFSKVVPHCDTEGLRQYIHPVMALFGHTGKEVVRVVDRSGIHRAKKLASTLAHWHEQFRLHCLPPQCGHHRNPIEGLWRVMKDRIGAGRCFPDLHQLYQRARQALMAHQGRPIYEFHW